jgi:glycosyltransferase involved in cell wall biosynthesis
VLEGVLDALPDVSLDIAGPFTGRDRLARWRDRIQFRGVLDGPGLAAAYAGADLLVHPAVGEAFGLVVFEAALHGTAAVVAGGHGCGEWYGAAGGCVVPADDAASLVDAIRVRLADPGRAQREAAAVASFVRRELTWDAAAERFEALYRELSPAGAGRAQGTA